MDLTNTFFIKVCNAKVKTRDSLKQHRKKVHRLVTPIPESCVLKPDDPELLRPILSVQVSFLLQLLYKIPSLLFFFHNIIYEPMTQPGFMVFDKLY